MPFLSVICLKRGHRFLPVVVGLALAAPANAGETRAKTDSFGDALPAGAVARIGTARLRHGDFITSLSFSADGSLLASGSSDLEPMVHLWDARTGKLLHAWDN